MSINSNSVYSQMNEQLSQAGYDKNIQLKKMEITYVGDKPKLHMNADVYTSSEAELMKLLKWLIGGPGFALLHVETGWAHLKQAGDKRQVVKQGLEKAMKLSFYKTDEIKVNQLELENASFQPKIYFDAEIVSSTEKEMIKILNDFDIKV